MTKTVTNIRARILRAVGRAAPPPVFILERLLSVADNRVLGLLVELRIPDALDRPRDAQWLAERTGCDAAALERVLRYAAARGFLGHRRGRYRLNAIARLLRQDHENSWAGWVEFASSDWFWQAWRNLDSPLRNGPSGTEASTGHSFFEYTSTVDPEAGATFDRAMQAGATLQGVVLAEALDWASVTSVCDVGGGNGAALAILLEAHPRLTGTLFDLPGVVAKPCERLTVPDIADRTTTIGGDFFERIPGGRDRYLLLAVVHDWDDEAAISVLRTVRDALSARSEVVVVESVLSKKPRDEFAVVSDLLMLTLAEGRERTTAEFERLFAVADLRLRDRRVLPSGFTAFTLTL